MADEPIQDGPPAASTAPNSPSATASEPPPADAARRPARSAGDAEPIAPDMPDLADAVLAGGEQSIEMLHDVELNVKVELGRCRMLVDDVLKLTEGSVVELEKLAGDPVDVFVNDRLVARGEVLVLNETFCVRVNEIISGESTE